MRIAYGVHGYGRGHATRALTLLPELTRRHEVQVFAGGDAYAALAGAHPVTRIPHLRYVYTRPGKLSVVQTLARATPAYLDLKLSGHGVRMVMEALRQFEPDVVLSDSDAWTLRAGRRLGVPRISFDHYGIMVYCRPPLPWWPRLLCRLESVAYRSLMGKPDRVIVSSFYDAPPRRPGVAVVGSMLRPVVRECEATEGEHLLVYFSSGPLHFTPKVEAALHTLDMPVLVYNKTRAGTDGNVTFRLLDNVTFVQDMASARAVFATAGNQLVGEAMHFGKPLLLLPEHSLEQHVNAEIVEHLGAGRQTSDRGFSEAVLHAFIANLAAYAEGSRQHARDGVADALAAVDRFLEELADGRPNARSAD